MARWLCVILAWQTFKEEPLVSLASDRGRFRLSWAALEAPAAPWGPLCLAVPWIQGDAPGSQPWHAAASCGAALLVLRSLSLHIWLTGTTCGARAPRPSGSRLRSTSSHLLCPVASSLCPFLALAFQACSSPHVLGCRQVSNPLCLLDCHLQRHPSAPSFRRNSLLISLMWLLCLAAQGCVLLSPAVRIQWLECHPPRHVEI